MVGRPVGRRTVASRVTGFGFYHGLAWAAEWYLGLTVQGKGTTQLSYRADGDLTPEQIRYAAADAVETLWVAEVIASKIDAAGLGEVCRLEQAARPFLDSMERAGLPFDWQGWNGHLEHVEQQLQSVLSRIAEVTGGGQASLFSDTLEPSWNPGSESQTKEALNRYSAAEVRRWAEIHTGEARLLKPTDPLRADTLAEIGGTLCELLLAYREHTKILTTYGDSIHEHIGDDGRIHPEYLQVVGTNTGRLASRNPNAQNLSPRMKPHFRPDDDRVFVHADLSQAELRFVAQVSGDTSLRKAFADGVDVHEATAERMFRVDMTLLKSTDPVRHAELRAKAKRINFGIVYGQRGGGLARSLSQSGVQTTSDEGRELLDAYLAAYPGVSSWCDERDDFIDRLSTSPGQMDWQATLRLHELFPAIREIRRDLREALRRWPSVEEVHERTGLDLDEVAWVLSFHAPVVLTHAGDPFCFDSLTVAGRRQRFTIHTEGLLARAAATVVGSVKHGPGLVRQRVARRFKVPFGIDPPDLTDAEIDKVLEERALRRAVIDAVADIMGPEALDRLMSNSLQGRVARMANAYRNAPIQGGVADVMLEAYGYLHHRLAEFPDTRGVQTVHDSVVVECPRSIAKEVAVAVKSCLEDAMSKWCPDVTPLADTDVRTSLSDSDIEFTIP
ncbi:MAG: DNA polymerase [Acidimicrobiales bacterium]